MLHNVMIWVSLSCYFLVAVTTNVMSGQMAKQTYQHKANAPYVHSADCQAKYYLQFDCFDKCNNAALSEKHAEAPLDQLFLFRLIGFDFHYHTPAVISQVPPITNQPVFSSYTIPTLHHGFGAPLFSPPEFI